jgi:hypothetical protein
MRFVIAGIALVISIMSSQLAFAQYYNTTTGNYGEDPNNPNSADNIIIKYCLDHGVAAGQNVVQDLVSSGMVPSYYDGKTCQQVNDEHTVIIQEFDFNAWQKVEKVY